MPPRVLRQTALFDYRDNGLLIPVGTTMDDWRREGETLQRTRRSIMWHLGDWAIWGETHFGELYADAVEAYSAESIQTAMRVCRRIPIQRRRDELGFSHHQIVAKFEAQEQDELLEMAVKKSWTRDELRDEVRRRGAALAAASRQREPELPEHPPQEPESNVVSLPVAATGLRYNEPAASSSVGFREPQAIEPAVRPEEPEQPLSVLSPDEAAAFLEQVARAAMPANIANAVTVLLGERKMLLDIVDSVRRSFEMNLLTPRLKSRLAAYDSTYGVAESSAGGNVNGR